MKKLKFMLIGATLGIMLIGISIKDITTTEYGTQITFFDNSGYWIEK